jgi:hypothetical protein
MILQNFFDAQCYRETGTCYISNNEVSMPVYFLLTWIIDLSYLFVIALLIWLTFTKYRMNNKQKEAQERIKDYLEKAKGILQEEYDE